MVVYTTFNGIDDLIRCYAIKLIRYLTVYLFAGKILLFIVVHGCFRVMFCNICFNSIIGDTLRLNKGQNLSDRITSSHYALEFRGIHVLQRKLYSHFISSLPNIIVRLVN